MSDRFKRSLNYLRKAGVEMKALAADIVSQLTVYNMCKAVDKTMVIGNIKLVEKTKR